MTTVSASTTVSKQFHRVSTNSANIAFLLSVIKMAPIAKHFNYLVLGGGSGGIASARRAAEFGVSVAIIEKAAIGGTCVSEFNPMFLYNY